MKTTKIILLSALMIALSVPTTNAQTYEWEKEPQEGEKEVELVLDTLDDGTCAIVNSYCVDITDRCDRKNHSKEHVYNNLFEKVKRRYGKQYPNFSLRQFKWREVTNTYDFDYYSRNCGYRVVYYTFFSSAILVIPETAKQADALLSKAIDKALMEVREGSRIAIDQIRVTSGINKEDYKDKVVEILLDKGFKVVAKEYLDRLYQEQQTQQSGIYNENTTVKENNLSAVGYYLNVKLTETTLRVQVINVSTGEYEGNVTVKLQDN